MPIGAELGFRVLGGGLEFQGFGLLRATVRAASHPEEGRSSSKLDGAVFLPRHAHRPLDP